MNVFLACDHAAYETKEQVKQLLRSLDYEVVDLGTNSADSVHYPDYAIKLAQAVVRHPQSLGVLLCGSGQGVAMVANRFRGVRAALCYSEREAVLSRQHNHANVLCLGARLTPWEEMAKIVAIWLKTEPDGGRHAERVAMFDQLGEKVDSLESDQL